MTSMLPPVSEGAPRPGWRTRHAPFLSFVERVRYILSSTLRVMIIFMIWVIVMIVIVRIVDILAFWSILKRALHIPS